MKDSTSSRGTPPRLMVCCVPRRGCVDITFVFDALICSPPHFGKTVDVVDSVLDCFGTVTEEGDVIGIRQVGKVKISQLLPGRKPL